MTYLVDIVKLDFPGVQDTATKKAPQKPLGFRQGQFEGLSVPLGCLVETGLLVDFRSDLDELATRPR